jgi:hypothetical protein
MANISGKSFIATLYCATEREVAPIDHIRSSDIAGEGWLVQGEESRNPLLLRFDFIEHVDDRIHYMISAAPGTRHYAGAKLGISRNGYLGFYSVADVSDYWKIELAGNNEESDHIEFIWRDHRGYRVGVTKENRGSFFFGFGPTSPFEKVNFLNVDKGSTAFFAADIIRYV